ncbi:MAG: hypothetical protein GX594_03355 [Pirellulaceae bacterium]|nr:hypothetical protein [Pirellulaceae bacterium]
MPNEHNAAELPEQAEDALSRAKAELERAKNCYENIRRETAERLKNVRKTTVGDIIDGTLETVKRHPAAGLGLAALLGFFLGRLFRR